MADCFVRFPRTPHLRACASVTRDDLVLTTEDADNMLSSRGLITIEEKVDGANLGVSFDGDFQLRLQKRGRYITPLSEPQYGSRLQLWLDRHQSSLASVLGTQYILFGEWLVAQHTVVYDNLPDYFLAFDIFDKAERKFLSRRRRDGMVGQMGLPLVPCIHTGPWDGGVHALQQLVLRSHSALTLQPTQLEGVYVRVDDSEDKWLVTRAKMVHPDFIQAIEEGDGHWSKRKMVVNRLSYSMMSCDTAGVEPTPDDCAAPAGSATRCNDATVLTSLVQYVVGRSRPAAERASGRTPTASGSQLSSEAGDRLALAQGVVAVVGSSVDSAAEHRAGQVPEAAVQRRLERRGAGYHMTLLAPEETAELMSKVQHTLSRVQGSQVDVEVVRAHLLHTLGRLCAVAQGSWVPLGVGQASQGSHAGGSNNGSTAYFVVVAWPAGQWLREQLGLAKKDFHITLGFTGKDDVHGVSKGVTSLLSKVSDLTVSGTPRTGLGAGQVDGMQGVLLRASALLHEANRMDTAAQGGAAWETYHSLVCAADQLLSWCAEPALAELETWASLVKASTLASLARFQGVTGDLKECERLCRLALSLSSPSASGGSIALALPHMLLAKKHFQCQEYEAALEHFTSAQAALQQTGGWQLDPTDRQLHAAEVVDRCSEAGWCWPVLLMSQCLQSLVDPHAVERGTKACQRFLAQGNSQATTHSQEPALGSSADAPSGTPALHAQILDPRSRVTIPNVQVDQGAVQDVVLPRNTSWVVPGQLLGSSTPKRREQVWALASLGVRVVVTLTEETPLPQEWFRGTGVDNVFVPVPNYEPPTVAQMEQMADLLDTTFSQGGAALVHCGGGKGRAGTVLACYLVSRGLTPLPQLATGQQGVPVQAPCMSAEEAVTHIRATRPGSIETEQQRVFVREWASHAWSRYAEAQDQEATLDKNTQPTLDPPAGGSQPLSASLTAAGSPSKTAGPQEGGTEYPRTPHLPFSPKVAADDVVLTTLPPFLHPHPSSGAAGSSSSKPAPAAVVVTEKLDGGNCYVAHGQVFARTHRQPATHPSFGQIKALASEWQSCGLLPDHILVYGENMAAVHGIEYDALTLPFYIFAVLDKSLGQWLSWPEVVDWADRLGCPHVPVIYAGPMPSCAHLEKLLAEQSSLPSCVGSGKPPREGFVVRNAGRFAAGKLSDHVAKYVCRHFTQSAAVDWSRHWKPATIRQAQGSGAAKPVPVVLPGLTSSKDASAPGPSCSRDGGLPQASRTTAAGAAGRQDRAQGLSKRGGRSGSAVSQAQQSGNLPKVLFLVGLPGSGKSTFAAALAASNPRWRRVCQDECGGSRRTCETEWSQVTLRELQHGARVILDRCNATAEDRRSWLDLALLSKRDKGIWAVYFDSQPDDCKARVMARTDHPTIPHGRGSRVVDSFAKVLQPPSVAEGFERVVLVRSFEEANELLTRWGAHPPEVTAPIAAAGAHEQGAAGMQDESDQV